MFCSRVVQDHGWDAIVTTNYQLTYAAVASGTGDDFKTAVRDKVKMYQSGPQQITGPDAVLEKGTLVRMIRKAFGYSLVQTAEGNQLGWVANEDLGPAPETAANP